MRLAELQQKFSRAVLDHELDPLSPWVATGEIPLDERFAVYRRNVLGNITDALEGTFPAVQALVGEDFFRGMARSFICANPPDGSCLIWYGGGFGDFIATYTPADSVPYLADVARYEWAWYSAHFVEDDVPLEAAMLEALEEDVLKALPLALRNGVALVASDYPVEAICVYARWPESPLPDMEAEGQRLVIWRQEREVKTKQLTPAEYAALSVFVSGGNLTEAVAAAMLQEPELDASQVLGTLFQLHILRQPQTMEAL